MNKKELKAKFNKAKKWCKEHRTELVMVLTGGIATYIATGRGYKKGWNDAFDKLDKHLDEHCAFLQPTETITPRDLMRDDAIKKTIIGAWLSDIFEGYCSLSSEKEVTTMNVEKTADEAINNLADILYGKNGPSVDLTPVFNDYENREDIRDITCEIQKIQSLSSDVDKAIGDIIYMYISYGSFAEGDKKLKDSESLLLTLNRILSSYEKYLTEVRTDLEFEKRRYGLIFKEGDNES